jgi:hypothetical protein
MATKYVTFFAAISLIGSLCNTALAKPLKASKAVQRTAQLSTDIKFDGLDATGRYQSPLGATAGIENEKPTLDLIDFRKSYHDRAEQALSGR